MTGAFGADDPGFGNLVCPRFSNHSIGRPEEETDRSVPAAEQTVRDAGAQDRLSVVGLDRRAAAAPGAIGWKHASGQRCLCWSTACIRMAREELVRSLRFRGLSTRSLKDIVAASDENYVFDFIDSNAPLALMGAGSFTTSASVIAPSLLFDELEFEPVQEETPKPPIVPPPPLGGAATIGGKQAAGGRRQENPRGVPNLSSSSCRLSCAIAATRSRNWRASRRSSTWPGCCCTATCPTRKKRRPGVTRSPTTPTCTRTSRSSSTASTTMLTRWASWSAPWPRCRPSSPRRRRCTTGPISIPPQGAVRTRAQDRQTKRHRRHSRRRAASTVGRDRSGRTPARYSPRCPLVERRTSRSSAPSVRLLVATPVVGSLRECRESFRPMPQA